MKVPGKISCWLFRPFWGQKYIACGDKMVFFGAFWPISSNILMLYGQVVLYEQYLLFIYEKVNLKFWHQNFGPVLDPFLVKKWPFLAKNQRFMLMLICWCCVVKFCYMNTIYCLLRINGFKILASNFLSQFGPFFSEKIAIFVSK